MGKKEAKYFSIDYNTARLWVIIYTLLPVLIFFMGWIKIYLAIPLSALLLIGAFFLNKNTQNGKEKTVVKLSLKVIIIIAAIALIWCFLSGVGGYWFQSDDFCNRNAIFRDLIKKPWPVYYTNNSFYNDRNPFALVYYIAFWIVPACFGKIALIITHSLSFAWVVGNAALYIYTSIGLFLVFLLLSLFIKAKSSLAIIAASLLFVFFSGLDGFSIFIGKVELTYHIEWWINKWFFDLYQYSSLTTDLFWAFNQSIVPWCIMLCILQEKKCDNLAFLGLLALPYSPLPFVGIFVICIAKGIGCFIGTLKSKEMGLFFKSVFSIQNIFAIIAILPVYYFYYSSNAATTSGDGGLSLYLSTKESLNLSAEILHLLLFWFMEFGLYALLIFKDHKKDADFYGALFISLVAPLFCVGTAQTGDFTMRTSIPAILVLAVFVIKYFYDHKGDIKQKSVNKLIYIVMIFAFLVGTLTPTIEFLRGINYIQYNGYKNHVFDPFITIESNRNKKFIENFVCWNPDETIYFKYISK